MRGGEEERGRGWDDGEEKVGKRWRRGRL